MLELLDSTRYSHTRIIEKGHSSYEVTMVQTSHRMGMVSESGHKTRIYLQCINTGNFFKIKVCLQMGNTHVWVKCPFQILNH